MTVRPYWLWPPPARAFHARVSRSIGCRCDASFERQFSGVVRGHRRALRRTGPRPPARRSELRTVRRHCGSSWLRRSGRARPYIQTRLASEAAKCVDGRPDASLEVSCPLQRSPAMSRLCVPGGATSPAIPLRPLTRVVVLLRPWSRVRACRASCDALHSLPRHRAPTHRRRWLSLRFYAWRSWPGRLCADRRRAFWPGRFAVLVASLHRTRPSPPRVMRRRFLCSAGVPLPAVRVTWPGRAPFRRSKLAWVSVP